MMKIWYIYQRHDKDAFASHATDFGREVKHAVAWPRTQQSSKAVAHGIWISRAPFTDINFNDSKDK